MLSLCRPHGLRHVEPPTSGVRGVWCILEQGERKAKAQGLHRRPGGPHFSEGCRTGTLHPLSAFPPQGVGVFAQLVARDGECPALSPSSGAEGTQKDGSGGGRRPSDSDSF